MLYPTFSLLLTLLLAPNSALGCAVCFGASDAPMAKGMNIGILFMLGLVGAVLSTFTVFFVYLGTQAKRASRRQVSEELQVSKD
jgi:hypothetical protein